MGDMVPLTREQEDWTFFSDLVESYWSESDQSFALANLKVRFTYLSPGVYSA